MLLDNLFDINKYPRFITSQLQPDDNGPCLCLSGKNYKDCCKEKIAESRRLKAKGSFDDGLEELFLNKESKLPSRKLAEKIILKKKMGYCMAAGILNDCSCINGTTEPNVRFSHTLSRGFVLKNLCNSSIEKVSYINDHIMVNDMRFGWHERFNDIPIKEASITTSFCSTHDDYLFAEIEKEGKRDYTGSYIQSLEYALKAVTYDLFEALMYVYYLASLVEQNVNVVFDSENTSQFLLDYRLKLGRFVKMKTLSDRLITDISNFKNNGDQSCFETIFVGLKKISRVEYSSADVFEDGYFVNVVNAPDPVIILSHYPDNNNGNPYILELLRRLKHKENERNLGSVTEYILNNATNIYFNSTVINSLAKEDLERLYIVHREGIGALNHSGNRTFSDRMIYRLYRWK